MVETPLDISLTIVNRLLGGGVQISESPRRLNEVEISLMDDVISIIGSEWANLGVISRHPIKHRRSRNKSTVSECFFFGCRRLGDRD